MIIFTLLLAVTPSMSQNLAVLSEEDYPICGAVILTNTTALTAAHCVVDTSEVMLRCGGENIAAHVQRRDYNEDLATLDLLSPCNVPPVKLAAANPTIGEEIFHTGYPRHMPRMTRGIVSSYESTSVPPTPSNATPQSRLFLVSDITIDGGSSGGGIYNGAGELVGICTMTEGKFGFFSPVSRIRRFLAKSSR